MMEGTAQITIFDGSVRLILNLDVQVDEDEPTVFSAENKIRTTVADMFPYVDHLDVVFYKEEEEP